MAGAGKDMNSVVMVFCDGVLRWGGAEGQSGRVFEEEAGAGGADGGRGDWGLVLGETK